MSDYNYNRWSTVCLDQNTVCLLKIKLCSLTPEFVEDVFLDAVDV